MRSCRIVRYVGSLVVAGVAVALCIGGALAYRRDYLDKSLIAAVKCSDAPSVVALLADGADVDACDWPLSDGASLSWSWLLALVRRTTAAAPTALQIAVDRHVVRSTSPIVVRQLIEHGADLGRKDRQGNTPLVAMLFPTILATPQPGASGNVEPDESCALMLVEAGADVNASDRNGLTPIMRATYGPLIRGLLDRGAYTELPGASALSFAAFYDDKEKATILVGRHTNIDVEDSSGETPLMTAACQGHATIVSLLLSHGASVNHRAKNGRTPLIEAVASDHAIVARELIACGADASAVDENGRSALAWARRKNNQDCVRLFMVRR